MSKNEIHARLSPQLMDVLKRICSETGSNLSDVTRAALVLYVDAYECPHLFEHHKLLKNPNSLEIGLIGTSLETTRATPDLLDEVTPDDVIDWLKESKNHDRPRINSAIANSYGTFS
jgi:hypothetical protein